MMAMTWGEAELVGRSFASRGDVGALDTVPIDKECGFINLIASYPIPCTMLDHRERNGVT